MNVSSLNFNIIQKDEKEPELIDIEQLSTTKNSVTLWITVSDISWIYYLNALWYSVAPTIEQIKLLTYT